VSLVSCKAGYIETAENGHSEIVKLLIESGANIHADNDYAVRWAAKNGHSEIVKLLIESGANIHTKNDYAVRRAVFLYLYFAEQNKILGTHSVACILLCRIHRNC